MPTEEYYEHPELVEEEIFKHKELNTYDVNKTLGLVYPLPVPCHVKNHATSATFVCALGTPGPLPSHHCGRHHGYQMAVVKFLDFLCVWPFALKDYGSVTLH